MSDYGRFNAEMNYFVSTLEFDRETISWTGFKVIEDQPDKGAGAQWVYMVPDKDHGLYHNISGVFPGQDAETISNTKAMIRAGLKKLQEMIEAEAV